MHEQASIRLMNHVSSREGSCACSIFALRTVQFYLLSVAVQLYRITQGTRMQANVSYLNSPACLSNYLVGRPALGSGECLSLSFTSSQILACCETQTFTLAEDGGFHSGASIPLLPHVIKTRHPHQQTRPARESLRLRRVRASRIRRSWAGIQNIACLGHFRRSFRWVHRVSHQSRRQRCP